MTFTLEYSDERDIVRKLRAALLAREEWITPKELHYRYDISSSALTQRLGRWQRNGLALETQTGASGRIILLKMTPELRAKMEAMRGRPAYQSVNNLGLSRGG